MIALFLTSLAIPQANAQEQALQSPMVLGKPTTFHVRITYTFTNTRPGEPSSVYLISPIPRQRPWSGNGASEGVTNFRAFPFTPAVEDRGMVALHQVTHMPWPQTWEVDRLRQKVWAWKADGVTNRIVRAGCEYDVTSVSRTLDVAKTTATIADLASLPSGMQSQISAIRRELPPECFSIVQQIKGNETNLARIVEKFSYWVGKNITYAGDEYPGGPYLYRYDLTHALNNRRGWCGPRSTVLRALCIALGVPAREVNGFALHTSRDTSNEPINARNGVGNAHVWAEVYLPHLGWVELNPTQGHPFTVSAGLIRVGEEEDPRGSMWGPDGGSTGTDYDDRISVTIVKP